MKSVKTNRSLLAYIILTAITFGIYGLWFLYKMKEDVNTICREDGKKTPGLIVLILLSIITCGIYSIVWQFLICERVSEYERRHNMPNDISGGKYLAWSILGSLLCGIGPFVAMYLLIKGLNNIAVRYTATAANAGGNSRPSNNNSGNTGSRGSLSSFGNSSSSNSGGTDSFGNGSSGGTDSFGNGSSRGSDSFGNGSSRGSDSFGNSGSSSSNSGKTDSFGNPMN